MNITIEKLQLNELLSNLHEQAKDTFPSLRDEKRLNSLAEKWHNYAEFCTIRDDENHLFGMIAFYANRPEGAIAYIPHVYVSSFFRCKGIFKQMLCVVESYVKEKGYNELKLEVQKSNQNALKSYKRTGFTVSGVASKESLFLTKTLLMGTNETTK